MVSYPTGRRRVLVALGAGLAVVAVGGCASAAGAPSGPARIACASGAEELHAALLLGADPVLAARGPGDPVIADLGYRLDGVPRPDPADGDALAAALAQTRPDIVLHTAVPPSGDARAVLVDPSLPVDDQLLALGAALRRDAEAEQAIAGHGYLASQVAAVVAGSVLAGATVAVIAPGPGGPTMLGADSPAGAALHAAGVGALLDDPAKVAEADFWLRVAGTPLMEVPAERAAWVGPEFVLESALVRLARLRQIDRLARWFSGVPR
ncbi:hypothetical protein [Pseudonocardia sp.]|uniref:hypothetical protein n=1 Tax=Pseudonocardia sp. TaxID=60912 RepID=UPI003D0CAEF7